MYQWGVVAVASVRSVRYQPGGGVGGSRGVVASTATGMPKGHAALTEGV